MKKLLFCAMTVALVASVVAAETKKPLTDAEKAALKEMRLQKTGGIIIKQGDGKLILVNAQKKFAPADIDRVIAQFRDKLRINVEVRPGSWQLGDKIPADANLALYLVDDVKLPMSLVAMEARWGVVNVAPLGDDVRRFDRELTRVAVATLGGGVSQYKASPMQPVMSPADLDDLVGSTLTIDSAGAMKANLSKAGMSPSRMVTYRKACQEGWAPQPTNNYQRAIWDEIHTLPSEPLKLKK